VAGFKKLYFDSVLFAPDALNYLCGCCGHDKVMLGSDYPFPIGDTEPLKVVEDADLTDAQKQMILGETAARLFA
jgi:aminocarboxymuconate-semialdehyde decarboxylase